MPENVRVVYANKEGRCWYIDDDNGFSHSDNQLVAGIPEIIEAMVGPKAMRVKMEYSATPQPEALRMRLESSNQDGSMYSVQVGSNEMNGWLCRVFYHYFADAPKDLYVRFSEA